MLFFTVIGLAALLFDIIQNFVAIRSEKEIENMETTSVKH
jgi:hypothetical protein